MPIGPGKADQRRRRARSDRRRLDDHRHPQLPQRRHVERLRSANQRRRLSRSVPMSSSGADPIIYDGSARRSRARHAVPEPGGVRDAAVVGAGHSDAGSARRPPILDVRGPAFYTEDLGFLKRFGVRRAQRRSSGSTSSTCSIARVWLARTPICRARTSARSSASARARGGCSCRCGRRSRSDRHPDSAAPASPDVWRAESCRHALPVILLRRRDRSGR